MRKVKVKLDEGAVRSQLLKGAGAGVCLGIANQMANKAGTGFAARVVDYPERTGAIVFPKTAAARRAYYRDNALEKARGGKYNVG